MRKFWGLLAGMAGATLWVGVGMAAAQVSYGSGYYTNLCDSGTSAKYYSCDPGCDPVKGVCNGQNNGTVKWTCDGKLIQCLESESSWNNSQQLGNPGCGKTEQISLFDKKCRREDGTWDTSCVLKGYMVWYSGDCTGGQAVYAANPTTTPKPTATPVPTLRPTGTVSPTITPVTGAEAVCNKTCNANGGCQAGFVCTGGVCRNPACAGDKSCFCNQQQATSSAVAANTPSTGLDLNWLVIGLAGLGAVGWKLRQAGNKMWDR